MSSVQIPKYGIGKYFTAWRKHEFSDRLRNYQMNTKHEAYISITGGARGLGKVLGYFWYNGVYFVEVDYNGREQVIPAEHVRLLSPAI